jgi:hypothetical protein
VAEEPKNPVTKSVIGVRKMVVLLWCVTAIVVIVLAHIITKTTMAYPSIVAMMLITALGGVDVWKQGILEKLEKTPL